MIPFSAGAPPPVPPPQADIFHLETDISQLKTTTSAICRIPPELLQVIFIFGLYPRCDKPGQYYPPEDIAYPWTLSQVCRHWRNTALCTPEMWSYLPPVTIKHLQLSEDSESRMQYDMIKLMIERSKDQGLHVVVSGPVIRETPLWSPCFDLLVQNSDRWESAALVFNQQQLVVFTGIKGHISRLRNLYLVFLSTDDTTQVDPTMFLDAPQLQDVFFVCDSHVFAMEFPASQVEHLALRSFWDHPLQIVSSNVDTLQTLILGSGEIPSLPAMLTLPNLTKIHIYSHQSSDISGMDHFIVPALEEFYFESDHITSLDTALALLQRSSQATTGNTFSLKRLGFGNYVAPAIELSPDTLVAIFQLVSSSVQSLQCPLLPLALIRRFSEIEPENVLLPLLEYCVFSIPADVLTSVQVARALNRMGISRCEELPLVVKGLGDDHQPLKLSFIKRLRYFSIKPRWPDEMTRFHYTLDNLWTTAPDVMDEEDANASEEQVELERPGMVIMEGLTQSMRSVVAELEERRVFGNPASLNPFHVSKMYISRQQADTLATHFSLCKNGQITVQDLAVSRISDYEYSVLRRCLRDMSRSALIKEENPHLQELEKALEELIEAWVFMVDENPHLIHWVYDSFSSELIYFPLSDGRRPRNDASALVLDTRREPYYPWMYPRNSTKEAKDFAIEVELL